MSKHLNILKGKGKKKSETHNCCWKSYFVWIWRKIPLTHYLAVKMTIYIYFSSHDLLISHVPCLDGLMSHVI